MHAATVAAKQHLEEAFALCDELYNAATGDRAPQDERIVRLGYAIGEDVSSFKETYQRDSHASELLDEIAGAAQDIVDLVRLGSTPREAVASRARPFTTTSSSRLPTTACRS
jgi:hypothetical protein